METIDLAHLQSEMLAYPVPLFGDKRVNSKTQVITMACQFNRRECADKAVDDNEGKGYDDDVKRLRLNTSTPQGELIRSSLALR